MARFSNVGAPVLLAPGGVAFWFYRFGAGLDRQVQIAGPDIKTPNAGAVLLAFDQPRKRMTSPTTGTTYFVTIRNQGPGVVRHNLQGGGLDP